MVTEISEETEKEVFAELTKHFFEKRRKKGRLSFNSMAEIFGKGTEEWHECLCEFHAKDKDKFYNELMDMAVVALWGLMSKKTWDKSGGKGYGK